MLTLLSQDSGDFSSETDLERWRIPRPRTPATSQRVLIEGLAPGTAYNFFVQPYDSIGNTGVPARVTFTVPAPPAPPALVDGGLATPDPTGKEIRTVTGVFTYFGACETARINPATGNRIEDGYTGTGADDYKKANVVWDAGSNRISLRACRNEMVGVQLILQRLATSLNDVSVSVTDLAGRNAHTGRPVRRTVPDALCDQRFEQVLGGGSPRDTGRHSATSSPTGCGTPMTTDGRIRHSRYT